MSRLLITGGRDYKNAALVYHTLSRAYDDGLFEVLISGAAPGVDTYGINWCRNKGIPVIIIPAHWTYYGGKAGPIRNEWMIVYGMPTCALVFPGGTGTANMRSKIVMAKIPFWDIDETTFPELNP